MNTNSNLNRRGFLRVSASSIAAIASVSSLCPAPAAASKIGDDHKYDFLMGRVKFVANRGSRQFWAAYPGSDKNLLQEFSRVCRCKVKLPPRCEGSNPLFGEENQFNGVVDFTSMKDLRRFPFLFMTSEYDYTLSHNQKQNLRQYINEGGFLLMDDCVVSGRGDFFYQSSHRLIKELFPADSVRTIPLDHEIFSNVYDFSDKGFPLIQGQRRPVIGVFVGDRLAIIINANDLHCGWYGWTGKHSREYKESIKMGINIITYAISH